MLRLILTLIFAYPAYGQVIEPFPLTNAERQIAERQKTDISKVFDAAEVGMEPATFVNPIVACIRRYDGQIVNDGSVNCRKFQMGSPAGEKDRDRDERQHAVRLAKDFWIQAESVTQLQWLMVMKGTDKAAPSHFRSDCDGNDQASYRIENSLGRVEKVVICKNHPVEMVSYDDITRANGFLARLNASQSRYIYRLPTEAEWEYSARGGELRADGAYPRYFFGDDEKELRFFTFYRWNSKNQTHAIVQKRSNGYGLFDMFGNVAQWVSDYYDHDYGLSAGQLASCTDDPMGPASGSLRVLRGGSWAYGARHLRSADRFGGEDIGRWDDVGFRLVRTPLQ